MKMKASEYWVNVRLHFGIWYLLRCSRSNIRKIGSNSSYTHLLMQPLFEMVFQIILI